MIGSRIDVGIIGSRIDVGMIGSRIDARLGRRDRISRILFHVRV